MAESEKLKKLKRKPSGIPELCVPVEKKQSDVRIIYDPYLNIERSVSINSADIISIIQKYIPLLKDFYDIDRLITNTDIPKLDIESMDMEPSHIPKGNTKIVRHIKINGVSYAKTRVVSIEEYETHLQLLYLYYRTLPIYNWLFKIPKIYPIISDPNIYIMDFVNICETDTIKRSDAKTYKTFPPEIRQHIGIFLGLFCASNHKMMYDFELYAHNAGDDIHYYILDFGNYNGLIDVRGSVHIDKMTYDSIIHDNILRGLKIESFKIDFIDKQYIKDLDKIILKTLFRIDYSQVMIGGTNKHYKYYKKYIKYKNKYYSLKK